MGILGPLTTGWRWIPVRDAVRAGVAAALLGWSAIVAGQAREPREVKLEILASAEWTPAGIDVQPDDSLDIEAEPAGTAGGAAIPPDGIPVSPTHIPTGRPEDLPAPDLPFSALIGRIGSGPIFLVGAHYQVKATSAGPLHLRWNRRLVRSHGVGPYFLVTVRHEPAPVEDIDDDDDGTGNDVATNLVETDGNVVEDRPVETVVASPRPRRDEPAVQRPPARGEESSGTAWLVPGLVLLLLAAVAAGLTLRRVSRARTVERTRALLGVSPSLDLSEGSCRGDDLPAEGPAASLRARLEPGAAHMEEGSEHG